MKDQFKKVVNSVGEFFVNNSSDILKVLGISACAVGWIVLRRMCGTPVAYWEGKELHAGDTITDTATGKVLGRFKANRWKRTLTFVEEKE
jgi:hypothetical protein